MFSKAWVSDWCGRTASGGILLFCCLWFLMGCGETSHGTGPVSGGNTQVTLLLSSTANDSLAEYGVGFTSIVLTNQSGQSVPLMSENQGAEFIHLNGTAEPLLTVSIPQDVYTSAAIQYNAAGFETVFLGSNGGLNLNEYVNSVLEQVNLPGSSLTISGANMALLLDLQVSQSGTPGTGGLGTYTITPTFELNPITVAAQPTNYLNGKLTNITGSILSASTTGFTLQLDDFAVANAPNNMTYNVGSTTVYQGVSNLSSLTPAMSVNIDAEIQADGSMLATRVYVPNPTAVDTMQGMILQKSTQGSTGQITVLGLLEDGKDYVATPISLDTFTHGSSTTFQVAPTFTNQPVLPFMPSFNASNFAVGQNVSASSASILELSGGVGASVATVTLMLQTINGTVTSASSVSGYSVYNVTLLPDDSIVELGGAQNVVVYVSNAAQMLNANQIGTGGVFRFHGFLFNDNGTLRMVCDEVLDGVAD
jgi:hypothetical protein